MNQKNNSKKVLHGLFLCDYKANTGFGTVSHNIIPFLKKNFGNSLKMDICAINYYGESTKDASGEIVRDEIGNHIPTPESLGFMEDENTYVFSAKLKKHFVHDVAKIPTDIYYDSFGRGEFLAILKDKPYDFIFINQDLGIIQPIIAQLKEIKALKRANNQKQFKSIFYFPIDNEKVPSILFEGLEFFDYLITYTEFGRKVVLSHNPKLKVEVLFHGVNTKHFYPTKTTEFRKHYFGKNANKLIIGNINRNNPRKAIPDTILAFIEAKKQWDKALPQPFLYLHTQPDDTQGFDLRIVLSQTDLVEGEDYMFPSTDNDVKQVPIETLNLIYNSIDCFVTTTLGGGFELSVVEAMACKTPCILPSHTSLVEISNYGKNAYMIDELIPVVDMDNLIRLKCDERQVAEAMINCCKEDTIKMAERAYDFVLSKMNWDKINQRYVEILKSI